MHPLKSLSGNMPVLVSPIVLYTDGFSGKRGKKWKKFDAWCMTLAGLPKSEARSFHYIHFIVCSNKLLFELWAISTVCNFWASSRAASSVSSPSFIRAS